MRGRTRICPWKAIAYVSNLYGQLPGFAEKKKRRPALVRHMFARLYIRARKRAIEFKFRATHGGCADATPASESRITERAPLFERRGTPLQERLEKRLGRKS
jgi:hypothetical protein